MNECFPQDHPLLKIFNKNTLKLSYSCMPNIANIISAHKSVLNNETRSDPTTQDCNCRQKKACPLSGKSQTEGVVYQATVTREDNYEEKTYVGLTEGAFKTRYYNHICSFRNPKHRNSTELSKYMWHLKDSNVNYSTKWKIIKQCRPYSAKPNGAIFACTRNLL